MLRVKHRCECFGVIDTRSRELCSKAALNVRVSPETAQNKFMGQAE